MSPVDTSGNIYFDPTIYRLRSWPESWWGYFPFLLPAAIGKDTETGALFSISDAQRCSGRYVLGKPRTGKSWLLVNLALQDIKHGRGLFFLDPHGDAITDIIDRAAVETVKSRFLLLDPETPEYTFGINILECDNIERLRTRSDTYPRAKGVFDKLWKRTFEEKPWLQMILQNTIHAFIENQGYTLADLPLFYRDGEFRNYIASNIKYNRQVRGYWLKGFTAKSRRDQQVQMEAAETRAAIMLSHPLVNDIVGQTKTTVGLPTLIEQRAVILVRLSNQLSYEIKQIIGTILVSELRHAVERRPAGKRRQFGIFVDEFQTFASYQDFTALITQAAKYGIATTIAHHERYGQLFDEPQLLGATAAISNKVLFQITPRDARELAPEFAKAPPTETRREQELVISQYPVFDLLRGHRNPRGRAFVDKHLRPLKEQIEDLRGEIEDERLARTNALDQASLSRLDERVDWLQKRGRWSQVILGRGKELIEQARSSTDKIETILATAKSLRQAVRNINRFLTIIMEGKSGLGHEDFSNFLIERIRGLSLLSERDAKLLELYVALTYGDAKAARSIPFDLAEVLRFAPSEGAFVMRRLLYAAQTDGSGSDAHPRYGFSMLWQPGIEGSDPLEVFLLVGKVIKFLAERQDKNIAQFLAFFDFTAHRRMFPHRDGSYEQTVWRRWKERPEYEVNQHRAEALSEVGFPPVWGAACRYRCEIDVEGRKDVAFLRKAMKKELEPVRTHDGLMFPLPLWRCGDELARAYSVARACEIVSYGEEIANLTFPPLRSGWSILTIMSGDIEEVFIKLVKLFKEAKTEAENEPFAREREFVEKKCEVEVRDICVPPPAALKPRVLSAGEVRELRQACTAELRRADARTQRVAEVIDEFAEFCKLMGEAENYILVPSGQYVEKQVNTRHEQDMVNEIERGLAGLPKYTAYAKVAQEEDGIKKVRKEKIHTLRLDDQPDEGRAGQGGGMRWTAVWCRSGASYVPRAVVEQEMIERQEGWRRTSANEAPVARGGVPRDEPPPTHS